MPRLMPTMLLLLALLLPTTLAGAASAARTAVAPIGGPSANNTVTKIQAWLQDEVAALDIQHQLAARLYADVNLAEYKALLANEREPPSKRANASAVAALAAYRVAVQALPFRQVSLDPAGRQELLEGLSPTRRSKRQAASPTQSQKKKVAVAAAADNSGAFEFANFKPASNQGRQARLVRLHPGPKKGLALPSAGATPEKLFVLSRAGAPGERSSLRRKEFIIIRKKSTRRCRSAQRSTRPSSRRSPASGSLNSTERTEDQSTIPVFWADGPGTPTVAGHYLQIAAALLPKNASLLQTAELFARIAVANSDAATLGWVLKYRDLAARPITALRRGGNGAGSNLSEPLPSWEPLLKTPPHPEYPERGHTLDERLGRREVLAAWFGRDGVAFSTSTGAKGLEPRHFTSLRASAAEVGDSRVYGGIHYNRSSVDGNSLGTEVAKKVDAAFNKTFGS